MSFPRVCSCYGTIPQRTGHYLVPPHLVSDLANVAVFHHRGEPSGRWDIGLPRTLSQICGGFAAGVEVNRTGDEYSGLVLCRAYYRIARL